MYNFDHLMSCCEEALECLYKQALLEFTVNRHKIDAVFEMLADSDSKAVYLKDLAFKVLQKFVRDQVASESTGNISEEEFKKAIIAASKIREFDNICYVERANCGILKYHDLASVFIFEQYTYKDLVGVRQDDVVFDCGACLGDAALYFLNRKASQVYSFEIDHENLVSLAATFKKFRVNVEIVPKALRERTGTIFYNPPKDLHGAGVVENEKKELGYEVECTTIDNFCQERNVRPNFIKMDIEGSELYALKGGIETIKKFRPRLAVSIYHSITERWLIPLYLRDNLVDYEFYLKKSQPLTETVLFAKPREEVL